MQMIGRVLLVTPAAQMWLQAAMLDSQAMEAACSMPPPAQLAASSSECPQVLRDRTAELAAPIGELKTPAEALFAPSVLHALCIHSLALFASAWAHFFCTAGSPIALSLRYKLQQDDLITDAPDPPPHSLVASQNRSQQVLWLAECVNNVHAHRENGIASLLTTLDASLPPLTQDCLDGLPRCQVEWASSTPLCPGDAPEFVSLRRSARARGKVVSALMLVSAAMADVPDGIATPVLTAMHAHARGAKGGGLGVLARAVAASVTWVHLSLIHISEPTRPY